MGGIRDIIDSPEHTGNSDTEQPAKRQRVT